MFSTISERASAINSAMVRVYNHMMFAVLTSMAVSYLVSTNTALMAVLFGTALKWVVLFAPLAFVFAVPTLLETATSRIGKSLVLHGFAALMGLSMSGAMAIYTGTSIVTAFMGAAVLFGTLSVYGYFTKQSLDSIGKYLFVALIAIIIASIINIFIGSSVAHMVISAIAILVFMGFTAYDTQKIREQLMDGGGDDTIEIMGALNLYLDFINLFINLLSILGVADKD